MSDRIEIKGDPRLLAKLELDAFQRHPLDRELWHNPAPIGAGQPGRWNDGTYVCFVLAVSVLAIYGAARLVLDLARWLA